MVPLAHALAEFCGEELTDDPAVVKALKKIRGDGRPCCVPTDAGGAGRIFRPITNSTVIAFAVPTCCSGIMKR